MHTFDSSITAASFKDFYRLGKFDKHHTRPRHLLIKFLWSFDATLVLSNRKSLTSGISIKLDLTLQELKIENVLLKERRKLTDSSTEQKFIRIHGNSLYLNNKLHGIVQDSEFCLANTASTATSLTSSDNSHNVYNNSAKELRDRPTSDSNWLSVLYTNPQSIANKLKQFWSLVYSKSPDIIGLTETWPNENIFDNEILPSNYTLFCKHHLSHGGGVLIAVNNKFTCQAITSCENLEITCIKLHF